MRDKFIKWGIVFLIVIWAISLLIKAHYWIPILLTCIYALGLYNYGLNSPIFSEKIINPVPFNFAGLSPNMNTPQGLYLSIKKQFENGNSNARIRGDGEKVGLGLGECNK